MLDLGGVPLLAKDRTDADPFVIVGGPCVYNPEPLADFLDFAVIGEGEEVLIEVMRCFKEWKREGKHKHTGYTGYSFLNSIQERMQPRRVFHI